MQVMSWLNLVVDTNSNLLINYFKLLIDINIMESDYLIKKIQD